MDREGMKQVLRELLEAETLYGYPEIGTRWDGGTMVLKPADDELQPRVAAAQARLEAILQEIG